MLWLRTALFTLVVPGTVLVLVPVALIASGIGTPAPYDAPRELVVAGLYRYVRNPQYVGVLFVAVGEALLTGSAVLLGYAAILAIGYHLFVRYYEEPTLTRLFGEPYARYRKAVPRWLPRFSRRTTRCV